MPDRCVAGHVVVVEAPRVDVEELPPLVVVGPFYLDALVGWFVGQRIRREEDRKEAVNLLINKSKWPLYSPLVGPRHTRRSPDWRT